MGKVLRFERVLIAPAEADLERALTEAAAAANKGCRSRNLSWAAADTRALLAAVAAPEGRRQWNGLGGQKRRTSGNDTCSAVAVAWWTDPLGRPHYRIAGHRIHVAYGQFDNLFCPHADPPPLRLVHRDHVYQRDSEDGPLWVVCRCGAAGSPESLGWMGPHCAACHDRTEESATA